MAQGPTRVPTATYRLQFNSQFTFNQATEILEYLRDLGISDCYSSPLFQAGPNSTHGYDVCGFEQINPVLGGTEGFDCFSSKLQELGLGLLLDMVPNHMGNDLSNSWWLDVLAKGPDSPYATWFDIDWGIAEGTVREHSSNRLPNPSAPLFVPPSGQHQNSSTTIPFLEPVSHKKLLLPTLEDHYGAVLESGKIRIVFHDGVFSAQYYDRRFPLSWQTYFFLLNLTLTEASAQRESEQWISQLADIVANFNGPGATAPKLEQLQRDLAALESEHRQFRLAIDRVLETVNGKHGNPASFDTLHRILMAQHYRLAFWRVGPEEINYRRFFDVTELVSLRIELEQVFHATHRLLFALIRSGKVTGLRVDHPDGLWDPAHYLDRLQKQYAEFQGASGPEPRRLYVVAEKILTDDEPLPKDWAVDGTTGYDFLNRLNGLFIDSRNCEALDGIYREFLGNVGAPDFPETLFRSKEKILRESFVSELNALTNTLGHAAAFSRHGQDLTFRQVRRALTAVIANFPVYRTYAADDTKTLPDSQQEFVRNAVSAAKKRCPQLDAHVLDFLEKVLLLQAPEDLPYEKRPLLRDFVMRFQQLTGPVMAKGLEDTSFYNYFRLVSLNEVGGNPARFGLDVSAFHPYNQSRWNTWPHSLLATATHDTKRGEDVRARLNVLSEMPKEWRETALSWKHLNSSRKTIVEGEPAPSGNDEYLLYQTLVGTWTAESSTPSEHGLYKERITAYMLKAIREAKAMTSWTNPNAAYERATTEFISDLLSPNHSRQFLDDLDRFAHRLAFFGRINSLSQTLLKMTCPGVPDFYQGTELWDFSLVDPDNRRPVDFCLRRCLLSELRAQIQSKNDRSRIATRLLETISSGVAKLYLISQILAFRNDNKAMFQTGSYTPLPVLGRDTNHICAFTRETNEAHCIVVAPRLIFGLLAGAERYPLGETSWGDTRLMPGNVRAGTRYLNVLTDELLEVSSDSSLRVSDILLHFPVALLRRHKSPSPPKLRPTKASG